MKKWIVFLVVLFCLLLEIPNQSIVSYNLGVMYNKGLGVRQDYSEARKWFEKAAEQGFPEAQYNLGLMYYKGQVVRQDKRKAKEFFGKACDNGFQTGCDTYRLLNEQGY